MDVARPFYQLTEQACSGATRSCAGGDQPCREEAAKEGYVPISNYSFCRREEVWTEPRAGGIVLLVMLAVAAGALVVGWRRRRRRRAGAGGGAILRP